MQLSLPGVEQVSEYSPYSERQRIQPGDPPQAYVFEPIPDEMRVQAYYALVTGIGHMYVDNSAPTAFQGLIGSSFPNSVWTAIEENIKQTRGVLRISSISGNEEARVADYMQGEFVADFFLDAVELGFREAQQHCSLDSAIKLLNKRFQQHKLGYVFVGNPGIITRVDSQFAHTEIVEPAIALLHAAGHEGPLDEFMKAHQEYRRGDYKDAMNDANKAFESTMKAICQENNWNCEPGWNAKQLVKAMISNGLLHPSLESYFN